LGRRGCRKVLTATRIAHTTDPKRSEGVRAPSAALRARCHGFLSARLAYNPWLKHGW
jgi:hypothetical protein